MKLSSAGLDFLIKEEGRILKPYRDAVGYLTIGVGHLITKAEQQRGIINIRGQLVNWKNGLTVQQCKDLLAQDVRHFEATVYDALNFEPEQNQFDALVSLCFNIGEGAYRKSALLKELNASDELDYDAIEPKWLAWKNAGGKPILLARRKREFTLFSQG